MATILKRFMKLCCPLTNSTTKLFWALEPVCKIKKKNWSMLLVAILVIFLLLVKRFCSLVQFILLEHIKPLLEIWLKIALENVSRYGFNNNSCCVNNSLQKPLLAKRLLKGSFYPQKQHYHLMKICIGDGRTYVVSCILIF